MAQTAHLFLKANGEDIAGDSTITSLEREDSIECVHLTIGVNAPIDASGRASGRRQYEPLLIRKRIDKSSPLLIKGLANNEVIEAEFRFYRPNPAGDGTTEHFYTIKGEGGRINGFRQILPDAIEPASSNDPPLEEITFVFGTLTYTFEDGGIQFVDNWSDAS